MHILLNPLFSSKNYHSLTPTKKFLLFMRFSIPKQYLKSFSCCRIKSLKSLFVIFSTHKYPHKPPKNENHIQSLLHVHNFPIFLSVIFTKFIEKFTLDLKLNSPVLWLELENNQQQQQIPSSNNEDHSKAFIGKVFRRDFYFIIFNSQPYF